MKVEQDTCSHINNIYVILQKEFCKYDLICAANLLIDYNSMFLGMKRQKNSLRKIRKENSPFLVEEVFIFDEQFFIIKGGGLDGKSHTLLKLYLE